MTPRGLDHLVHLVGNLDAAGAAYDALGFTVGRENRHPFGTKNRIVQLPGFFIELLAVGDHAPIPEHAPGRFSFAAFHRDLLARTGEGGSALAFESHDARADAAAFHAAGFGGFEPLAFARTGVGPSGDAVEVAFELAFAVDPTAPDVLAFACEHKRPENFWSAAAQTHPNGATGLRSVTLTAENPSDHHIFLSTVTGVRDFHASSSGVVFQTPRGDVAAMTLAAYANRIGGAVAAGALRIAALTLSVADIERAEAAAGGRAVRRGETLVVPGDTLAGLTLVLDGATNATKV